MMFPPDQSSTLRMGPAPRDAAGTVILLHGRGGSAHDILGLAEALSADREIAFLAPSAATGAWYPQRFFVPLEENEPALSAALDQVHRLVAALLEEGIGPERIALAGFSQGGCLALEYAVRNPRPYGWVAGLSAALMGPDPAARASAELAGIPILIGCAESDPHIPLPFVRESADFLARSGAALTQQIFPGGDHTVFPEEIAWLDGQLSAWRSRREPEPWPTKTSAAEQ
jgi:predicted esterase